MKQELKTAFPELNLTNAREAAKQAGFEIEDVDDRTFRAKHCGELATISSLVGPYRMFCKTCGRAIRDITGPFFDGSCARLMDHDKFNLETNEIWFVESNDSHSTARLKET